MKDDNGNYIKCEATGKVCYTQYEAFGVIASCRRRHSKTRKDKKIPKRMYYCRICQRYHLTSRAKPKKVSKDVRSFSENY